MGFPVVTKQISAKYSLSFGIEIREEIEACITQLNPVKENDIKSLKKYQHQEESYKKLPE